MIYFNNKPNLQLIHYDEIQKVILLGFAFREIMREKNQQISICLFTISNGNGNTVFST